MLNIASPRKVIDRLIRLAADRRGMVFQETAIIMPILVTMMLSGYDIARFAFLQQKLSRMVMSTSDMISQGTTISTNEITTIFDAASTMTQPFPAGASQIMIVTSVGKTGANPAKVMWQRSGGGTLAGQTSKIGAVNANATLPAGFTVKDGEDVIITEVYYHFEAVFMPEMILPTTLYHRSLFRPRQSNLTTLCNPSC